LKNLLAAHLAENGYYMVDQPADGNCQFTALADRLSVARGTPIAVAQVRQDIATWLQNNNNFQVVSVAIDRSSF